MTRLEEHVPQHRSSTAASIARGAWPLAAALALAAVMQWGVGPWAGGYPASVMTVIGINIILAVSLTVVNGFTGQFSLGHAGFMAVGGYAAAAIVYYGSMKLWGSADFAGGLLSYTGSRAFHGPLLAKGDFLFLGGCLCGGVAAAVAGYLVGLPSLRLRGDYLAIVTLGFGEIVRVLFQATKPQLSKSAAGKIDEIPTWELPLMLGGAQGFKLLPTYTTLFWVYLGVGLTLIFVYRLKISSTGRAFLSIREDEIAAQAMGIDITKQKVRAFVLSSFLAGMAGGLYAMQVSTINAIDFGFQKSFDVVIMVVLGGMGSISGAALAAILLQVVAELLREPPPVWPAGVAVMAVLGARNAWRNERKVKAFAIVAAVTLVLEAVRWAGWRFGWFPAPPGDVPAGGGWSVGAIALYPVWPWGLAVLALIGFAQAWRNRWGVKPFVVVACVTGLLELGRWFCLSRGINIADYRLVLYALLLIAMMILRPEGLFGVNEIWDYFGARRKRLIHIATRTEEAD